jgi:hypothetical protein
MSEATNEVGIPMHSKDTSHDTRHDKRARDEGSCGHEIARDAEVPDLLGRLMGHVAENMVAHARWVRASSEAGAVEERGLLDVAEHYRAIATACESAAGAMRAMHATPPVAHDLARLDRDGLASWMKAKVALQRRLAHVLLSHADHSEEVLRKMDQSTPESPE